MRQAHPGPGVPAYRSYDQKAAQARTYKEVAQIPWRVLVDDLRGTVHQRYSMLSDPSYLIDTQGRVAFHNLWTHAPALHEAIEALMRQDGLYVVRGGIDKTVHLLAAVANGWPALQRGLPQSFADMEKAAPGSARAVRLGYAARRVLAPLALRSKPLPKAVRWTLTASGLYVLCHALPARPRTYRGKRV